MVSAAWAKIELPKLDLLTAKRLSPLLSVGLMTLVFNTLCLKNVDASFFQVRHFILSLWPCVRSLAQIARGLLLPFTIAVSAAYTRNMPGSASLWAATVVTIGFFIGLSPSSYFKSTSGFSATMPAIYGCLSALLTAIHAVLIKPAHEIVGDNSVIKLAYWGNLTITVALIPFVVFNGELDSLLQSNDRDWSVFIVGSAVTGIFGFLLSVAGLLSIKVTSPVTHMFSSVRECFAYEYYIRPLKQSTQAARSVIQTMLGVFIFGDIITQ